MTAQPIAGAALDGLPVPLRDAIVRCAIVATFDDRLYAAALRPDAGPGLDELLDHRLIEELPGPDPAYRVTPGLQDAAWATWFAGAPRPAGVGGPLRSVAEAVAAHCAAAGNPVEQLRALLLLDQARAAEHFERAFAACDAQFDLAGCANLLAALDAPGRRPFVGAALAEARDDRCRYRTARDLFRTAYLASEPTRYLRRPHLEHALATVLGPGGPRVVRLHGSGGYGKSTLLRWLTARRCVLERVPCAYVDLDHPVDPVNATRYPALLLLEIAHQLTGQLRGRPFGDLLRTFGSYRAAMSVQTAPTAGAAAADLGTPAWDVADEEITSQFLDDLQAATASLPAGAPILVVLDTIEEAMLRPETDITTLTALLRRLTAADHGLRFVVAGRLTGAETDLPVDAGFGPARSLEVPGFTDVESEHYLRMRRVTDRALVAGIVARARGLPWQLAVWGDVVERFPGLTPELLDRVQPELAWVVDRVVARIDEPAVQWLLRYGSVLRTLRRDVAEEVLLPRIVAAFAGTPDDDPAQDARPPGALPVFGTGGAPPGPGAEFTALWERFLRYAATTSWMWLAPRADGAVELHPQVRAPLRRLVNARPVGRLLHLDAARWFAERAAADPGRWADWTCEELHHRIQADGPGAEPRWRAALARARRLGLGGAEIAQIAGEVLRDDHVDAEIATRTTAGGGPVLLRTTLAAAHAEKAWALCRVARRERLPAGHPTWSQVESALAAADAIGPDPESQPRRRAAAAALLLARGEPAAAATELAELAASDTEASVDRCIVLTLLAQAQLETGRRTTASTTLRDAVAVAAELGVQEVTARLAVALAEGSVMLGRLDDAVADLSSTAKLPGMRCEPELRRARARLAVQVGRPVEAVQLASEAEPGTELGPAQAEAELACGDPAGAIVTCSQLLAGPVEAERRAEVLVLRARARSRLLLVDDALDDLETAREISLRIGAVEAAGLYAGHAAAVLLHADASLRDAQQHLDEASRLALHPGSPGWTRARLLQAEVHSRGNAARQALRAAREALDTVAVRSTDPRRIAAVALAAWCWAPALEDDVVGHLATQLPRIRPETARLTALTALPDCPAWPEWGRHLLKLALPLGRRWESDNPEDMAWLDRRAVELLRIAGRTDDAALLLRTTVPDGRAASPAAGLTWLLAADRIDPDGTDVHRAAARVPDPSAYPLLAVAHGTVLAERRFRGGAVATAVALLDRAAETLGASPQRPTVWHARLAALRARTAPDPATATHHRLVATATRRELGLPGPTHAEEPAPLDRTTARAGAELRAVLDGAGALEISARRADGSAGRATLAATHPLVAGLHRENRTTGKSTLVGWVRRQLAEGSLLPVDDALGPVRVPDGAGINLRIVAEPPLAQLPWEVATLDGIRLVDHPALRSVIRSTGRASTRASVRVLQEALAAGGCDPGPIDGLHGPATARALLAFQEGAALRVDGTAGPATWAAIRAQVTAGPRTVLVVRGAQDADPATGSGQPDALTVEAGYAELGWTVHPFPRESLPSIATLVTAPVDVVHVTATMEVAGTMPYLGFGADPATWSQTGPETVTCTVLDDVVRKLARRGNTPLVVLDVVGRSTVGSGPVRRLMLRNDFAHQLTALGHCHAVLATGLAAAPDAARARARLLSALTTAPTADELVRLLRAGTAPGEEMPWAVTALFATVPAEHLPPLHREIARS